MRGKFPLNFRPKTGGEKFLVVFVCEVDVLFASMSSNALFTFIGRYLFKALL